MADQTTRKVPDLITQPTENQRKLEQHVADGLIRAYCGPSFLQKEFDRTIPRSEDVKANG